MSAPTIVLPELPELIASDAVNLAGQSDEDTGREHLSHSAVSSALSCKQLYAYQYEHEIEPIAKPAFLTMGGAFQKAIEHSDPKLGIDQVVKAAQIRSQEDEDACRINSTIVGAAAEAYLSRWGTPTTSVREFEYRVRLRNPWTGHYSRTFDLLGFADEVEMGESGPIIVENKLVGQITKEDVRRLPLDRQVSLECYGLWRATGQIVRQVRYRWTRKPSIKQKQTETVADFCERVIQDYVDRRDDFYTREELLFRSDRDLIRLEAELWEWADEVRAMRRRKIWPRNTSHCHAFGTCVFLPLCLGDHDAPSLYQPKEPHR
jgi:hypothetical protein